MGGRGRSSRPAEYGAPHGQTGYGGPHRQVKYRTRGPLRKTGFRAKSMVHADGI
jgi:hypothetical protein